MARPSDGATRLPVKSVSETRSSPLVGLSAISLLAYLLSTRTFLSENQIQHYTVDHLAQGSMKNGANSEMPCELQDT